MKIFSRIIVGSVVLLLFCLLTAKEANAVTYTIDPTISETQSVWVWDSLPIPPFFPGIGHWETKTFTHGVSVAISTGLPTPLPGGTPTLASYNVNSHVASVDLSGGETSDPITYFDINFPISGNYGIAGQSGSIEANIGLNIDGGEHMVMVGGFFSLINTNYVISYYSLSWGAPVTYSYGTGGTNSFTLDLNDISSVCVVDDSFPVMGTITNNQEPIAAIPEPGTIFLLGSGLLSVIGFRRIS